MFSINESFYALYMVFTIRYIRANHRLEIYHSQAVSKCLLNFLAPLRTAADMKGLATLAFLAVFIISVTEVKSSSTEMDYAQIKAVSAKLTRSQVSQLQMILRNPNACRLLNKQHPDIVNIFKLLVKFAKKLWAMKRGNKYGKPQGGSDSGANSGGGLLSGLSGLLGPTGLVGSLLNTLLGPQGILTGILGSLLGPDGILGSLLGGKGGGLLSGLLGGKGGGLLGGLLGPDGILGSLLGGGKGGGLLSGLLGGLLGGGGGGGLLSGLLGGLLGGGGDGGGLLNGLLGGL